MNTLSNRTLASPSHLTRNRFLQDCQLHLQSHRLELPTIPEVSYKIRKIINDENANSSKIARVVQIDPSITARLIKIANSPLFRGRKTIESCPEALTRLGLKSAQNIITVFSMKSVFKAKSAKINQEMIELWKHSSYVAAISAVMAHRIPGFDPDRAMLAGLIHDIGVVPILIHADEHPDLIDKTEDLDETIQLFRARMGVDIIRRWDFPDDFEETIVHAEDWYRNDARALNYSDIVMIAQLHSFIGTVDFKSLPPIGELPVYQKMADYLSASDVISILDNAKSEIEDLWTMLS